MITNNFKSNNLNSNYSLCNGDKTTKNHSPNFKGIIIDADEFNPEDYPTSKWNVRHFGYDKYDHGSYEVSLKTEADFKHDKQVEKIRKKEIERRRHDEEYRKKMESGESQSFWSWLFG